MNRIKNSAILVVMSLAMPVTGASLGQPAMAEEEILLEEIVTLGSRNSKPRTVTQSPVPIDVFSAREFDALGNSADITDNLKALVPSFTATPATGDGSAFVRPISLRGMAPDQILVLVNGKRRHRSALVHFLSPAAGNGAHGPDIGLIPSIALKSVEVLRDGAAAQYGSDAIAGVINFNLKNAPKGGSVQVQYGKFYASEQSIKVAANSGFALGKKGFLNISVERVDHEALSRGIQRPEGQALVDAGVVGVGADTPYDDAPFVQSWGRPETEAIRMFFNLGVDLNKSVKLYSQGNYASTEGTLRFFYRNTAHPTLQTLINDFAYTGALLNTGYTPFLHGEQSDFSLLAGFKAEFDGGLFFDFSVGLGKNALDYYLNNTTNPSLGLSNGEPAQRGFDVGGYEQEEIDINADFSKKISKKFNLAFGAEWREETYTVNSGEPNAYFGAGSNGLAGFSPQDSGSFDRDNYAIYVDIEHDISDQWLAQYALRYENFSDFGGTVNGKLATRFAISNKTALRAAISTGFHAPTPGQANVRTTITTFDGTTGLQVDEGLVPPTSPQALAAGGAPLKEEESLGYSMGFTTDIGEKTTLTVDLYRIEVDDRIYRTGDIAVAGVTGASISFYTNALDTESTGLDIVLSCQFAWRNTGDVSTDLSFAFNHNKMEVTDQSPVGGINPVSAATIEDIENNYPNERFVLSANTTFNEKWNFMTRINYYGDHYDERGTIGATVDPSAKISSLIYVDMELAYKFDQNIRISLGAVNIFDEFVDKISAPNANRENVGLQYPRRSAANYEGGSWYLSVDYSF